MNGTRPLSPARGNGEKQPRAALIVAHGSPSELQVQEDNLQNLAARVNHHLPGWQVRGATLAAEGSLERNARELGAPLVYPYFMAQGWFTDKILKEKTAALGLKQLRPFGLEDILVEVVASKVAEKALSMGWDIESTSVVVAAHGSKVSQTSAASAHSFCAALRIRLNLHRCVCGFVEEPPFIKDIATGLTRSICVPFFAIASGHVSDDLPKALKTADFYGPVLRPFIEYHETASLIAGSLRKFA